MALSQAQLDFTYIKSNFTTTNPVPITPTTYQNVFGVSPSISGLPPAIDGGIEGLSSLNVAFEDSVASQSTFCRQYDYAFSNSAPEDVHLVVATIKDAIDGGAWTAFETNAYSARALVRMKTRDLYRVQGTMIGVCFYAPDTNTIPASLYLKCEDTPTQVGNNTVNAIYQPQIKLVGISAQYGESLLSPTLEWDKWYKIRMDIIPAGDGFYHLLWYLISDDLDSENWVLMGTSIINSVPRKIGYFHCSIQGQGEQGSENLVSPATYIDSVTFLSENITI